MKEGLTEIVLVLDRSGSMSMMKNDAEGGLREFVKAQREVEGDAVLTFYRFDTVIENMFSAKPLPQVEDADLRLDPRGGTALLDAMGRAINEVGTRLSNLRERDRPSKVIFITVTDGQENSSREFTRERIFDMIKTQTDRYSWDFTFIGADQDAIQAGAQYGFHASATLNNASRGYGNTYNVLSQAVARSRKTGDAVCYTAEERTQAMTEDDKSLASSK